MSRSMLAVSIVALLTLLGVALYSRNADAHVYRTVIFTNPSIVMATTLPRPVSAVIEALPPNGGAPTPIAWAYMGQIQTQHIVPAVTIPAGATLQMRWTFDQGLATQPATGRLVILGGGASVSGGDATGVTDPIIFTRIGRSITGVGTFPLAWQPGTTIDITFTEHGPQINGITATVPAAVTPTAPTPPTTPPPTSPPQARASIFTLETSCFCFGE